jgi:uncharacterized protein with ParB-like and HNH nuclease domain
MAGKLIYSVKEVFTDYLSGEYKYYNIPEYQRGYKWNAQQIEQLLDDIDNFKPNGNADKFYCVQNITIVEKEKEGNKFYNVVDGQQRLTTLVVLLSYLKESNVIKNKLKYSVRPDTDNFISDFILSNKMNELTDWNSVKNLEGDKDYDHQDIYYLFNANKTIENWFANKDKDSFKEKLLNNVKLIVNKPDVDNEQELFMNLNTGKVSLDGADLVRALLITNVAKEELENSDLEDIKSIVRINERRVRIGLELDEISAWWNTSNVRQYFNFLDKIDVPDNETIKFNSKDYPVDLLYKLYSAKEGKKEIQLKNFEVSNNIALYKELISLHRTIKDWYQDYEIYHFVKFLLTHTNTNFKEIWKFWKENDTTRENFIFKLKNKIKNNIKDNIESIDKLGENWFDNEDLYKILILLDVIQIVNSQREENKLSKLEAIYFVKSVEDREHIFPQTPIGQKNTTKGDIMRYIEFLRSIGIEITIKEDNNWEEERDLEEVKNQINKVLSEKIHINSIGNLVLLHEKVNRGYGNEFYTKKRLSILQNTKKGKFIRPHTLNAFDKGFNAAPQDNDITMDNWTDNDIQANANYIKKQIIDFFNIKEENKNE